MNRVEKQMKTSEKTARLPIDRMLEAIERECRNTSRYTGIEQFRPEVMAAMARIPREEFVPKSYKAWAYENTPLPIGNEQTISQPFIVALMTDLLCPEKDDVILEVGTGSGYQAAILSLLVNKVYTLEIMLPLATQAAATLKKLGCHNVEVGQGDASGGWPEYSPYDGIIVTAAATHIPRPLKEQLRPGGRMIIPVGSPHTSQNLLLIHKDKQGNFNSQNILPVAFVPFTGELSTLGRLEQDSNNL